MKAIKNILLPVLLLCMVQEVWAAKTAQAVLMTDKTMYFVYDEPVTVGSTYKGKTVSKFWSATTDAPIWKADDDVKNVTKVVFDESFASVRVTDCGYWFMDMKKLETIEHLEYLNTSDVTDMFDMFANCSLLTTLDLSSFDTSKVTNMTSMFQNCEKLTTIYVSNLWNVSGVGEYENMFKDCSKLVGGNGTIYNSEHTGKDYARIDGGSGSWTPGYLTQKSGPVTLQLSDDADNAAKIAAYTGYGELIDIRLMGRTLYKDGYWNTLCLPFDLTIEGSIFADATVKVLDKETTLNGNTLTLKFKDAGTGVDAGTPFIVKWAPGADIVNPLFQHVNIKGSAQTVDSNDGKVHFVGTYSPFEITAENIDDILYIGSANKIGYAKSARTLKSCRAHFNIPATASARAVSTIDFIDDEATGVVLIDNGELIMNNEAGVWYTLDGRRLSSRPTTKGIYIHNGKKEAIR